MKPGGTLRSPSEAIDSLEVPGKVGCVERAR